MDTRQIEYILRIAEENNTTHAANKPSITQSAPNQQLTKLEQELGIPLFHRSRTSWHLTEAGEVYIRNAKGIMRLKRETYQVTHDLSDGKCGHLSVGFTIGRGINMFTKVYGTFHQLYPNVIIEPQEGIIKHLQKMISIGSLDTAFLTFTDKGRTDDIYESIYEEELRLVTPAGHPLASVVPEEGEDYAILDIRRFQCEPPALVDRHSTMNTMLGHIFSEVGFTPQVFFETGNNHTIISTIRANMCYGTLSYHYVKDMDQSFCCSHPSSRPTWQFMASYKKGRHLSRPACGFTDLMKEQWGDRTAALHTDQDLIRQVPYTGRCRTQISTLNQPCPFHL